MRNFIAAIVVLASTNAYATMPTLTNTPDPPLFQACEAWADYQSDDALEMWGIQDNGKSDRKVAIQRLTRWCMNGTRPAIVGFHSSAGFNRDYCSKHARTQLCKDYRKAIRQEQHEQLAPVIQVPFPSEKPVLSPAEKPEEKSAPQVSSGSTIMPKKVTTTTIRGEPQPRTQFQPVVRPRPSPVFIKPQPDYDRAAIKRLLEKPLTPAER